MLFHRKKYEFYRQFITEKEVQDFLKKYYNKFFHNIPESQKNALLTAHSRQLQLSFANDSEIISSMRNLQEIAPHTPYDIILFRGDDCNYYTDINRPFLAHTFLKNIADNFTEKDNIYQVYVPAGSRIIPTCGLKTVDGVFREQEVIIETEKLKKISANAYVYRNR